MLLKSFTIVFLTLSLIVGLFTAHAQTRGWRAYEGDGFTISVPSAWINLKNPLKRQEIIDGVPGGHPTLETRMEALRSSFSDYSVLLIDPITAAVVGIKVEETDFATLQEVLDQIETVYPEAEVIIQDSQIISHPSGQVMVLHAGSSQTTLEQYFYTYLFKIENSLYRLEFSVEEDSFEVMQPVFDEIVGTFTILAEVAVTDHSGPVTHRTNEISIATPPNWLNIADEDFFDEYRDQGLAVTDSFQESIERSRAKLADGTVELILVEPTSRANVNVAIFYNQNSITEPVNYENLQTQIENSMFAVGTIRESSIETLPAGQAVRVEVATRDGIIMAQYFFVDQDDVYAVSVGASAEDYEVYEPIFVEMLESFEILP